MSRPEKEVNEDTADLIREIKEEIYTPIEDDFKNPYDRSIPEEDELYDDEFDADEWFDRNENEDFLAQWD